MPDSSTSHPHNPGWYVIRIRGHLAPRWSARFDGMTLTAHDDGTTVIEGLVADQAALHGVLHTVGDLGLPLVSIAEIHTDRQRPSVSPHDTPQGD